jgi:hypothetical protein
LLSNYRLKEMRERRDRDEAADQERKLAPAKAALSQNLKRADALTRLYFSQDLRHLAQGIESETFTADLGGASYPRTMEVQTGMRGRAEYEAFCANLPRSGFLLSSAGAQRLLIFCLNQAFSENRADLANPETYRIAFDRLYQLGCFDESTAKAEIGYDASIREQEPVVEQPARARLDLEDFNTTTKDGEKLAHQILADAVFGPQGEGRIIFHQFISHVSKTFGHDLTEDEQRELIQWFVRNQKSFLDRRAYDLGKVNLVRRGILNHGCLTADELYSMGIEEEDTQSYSGRRNLAQELAQLRKQ